MKKFLFFTALTMTILVSSQTQANDNYYVKKIGSEYSNCAYKGKKASKKCLVTFFKVSSSSNPTTRQIFGDGEHLNFILIEWPDGDVSRYLAVGSDYYIQDNEVNRKRYKAIIDVTGKVKFVTEGKNHVELWY